MNDTTSADGIVSAADIRLGAGRSRKFIGAEHGADISYFYVENQPGEGPGLHWHPYSETWVVLEGGAQVQRGDDVLIARAGDTATVPPHVMHGFTNIGTGALRILCIHASREIIQTFAD